MATGRNQLRGSFQRSLTRRDEERIVGRWQITESELWDSDALNLVASAFIEFEQDGLGSFGFIAVQGQMDCREAEREGAAGRGVLLGGQR